MTTAEQQEYEELTYGGNRERGTKVQTEVAKRHRHEGKSIHTQYYCVRKWTPKAEAMLLEITSCLNS